MNDPLEPTTDSSSSSAPSSSSPSPSRRSRAANVHEISHALDASHGSPGLHGEQVALGALFATWLRGEEELYGHLDQALPGRAATQIPGPIPAMPIALTPRSGDPPAWLAMP